MPSIEKYRERSRDFTNKAREILAIPIADSDQLRLAALQLRMAIECLAYDRLQVFAPELGSLATWQPRKVMEQLFELDELAVQGCELHVGAEDQVGEPATSMLSLGSETVFSIADIKAHYDALGSFLHVPTLAQLEKGWPRADVMRSRCDQVISRLDAVLASPIWNINFAQHAQMACQLCGAEVRCRTPLSADDAVPRSAKCLRCGARYRVTPDNTTPGRVVWKALQQTIKCMRNECGADNVIWEHEATLGTHFKCVSCRAEHRFFLCIGLVQSQLDESATPI